MRKLLVVIVLIGAAVSAIWIGGETWLAREAARRIAEDPRIEAASVTPLREPSRIGMRLTDVAVETQAGRVRMPTLDIWAAPSSPTEVNAALPPQVTLPLDGGAATLGTTDGRLALRVSPTTSMAISRAAVASGPVTIDGKPLAGALDLQAKLAAMGSGAPQAARASYRLTAALDGLQPQAAGLGEPLASEIGPASLNGRAQVYLTGPVIPGEEVPPEVVGLSTEGMTLKVGERQARIIGNVTADDQGLTRGAVFVYTADPRAWLDIAANVGLVPRGVVALAGTALQAASAAEINLPEGTPEPPKPEKGEIRIPLVFADGRMALGPLQLGAAPPFPR